MLNPAPRSQVSVGTTTVTYLPDGEVHLDPAVLFPASAPDGWSVSPYLDADGRLPISVGSFLIRTEAHRILVDLGLGAVDLEVPNLASFAGGKLLDSLADEGLQPTDIDPSYTRTCTTTTSAGRVTSRPHPTPAAGRWTG